MSELKKNLFAQKGGIATIEEKKSKGKKALNF